MSPDVVRAGLIVRLNGLLQAHSGVRPIVLQRVAILLNSGLTPVVPRTGSLGASGDLAPSAHAFLPLIGEGELIDDAGQKITGAQALERVGLAPLTLSYKEALSLLNGTHFMAGIAALLSVRTADLLDTADAAAAMSIEALLSARSPFDPRVHALRRGTGQARSAQNIRNMTRRSRLLVDDMGGRQDPYSTRCVPQVHGAAREAAAFFDRIAEAEIDAVTDNPLVFMESPNIVSAGNFHGQSVALAFDMLRIAIADLASISERRIFRLLSPDDNRGLPPFLGDGSSASSGYMMSQYTAAALLSELRALAHPVSSDNVPTSGGQEDHVSMGMTGALMAIDAVDRLEAVLAIELVCGGQALDCRGGIPGTGTRELHKMLRDQVPPLGRDRSPALDNDAASRLIASGRVAQLVNQYTPSQ
jgi:histidine ammonia-lyase